MGIFFEKQNLFNKNFYKAVEENAYRYYSFLTNSQAKETKIIN